MLQQLRQNLASVVLGKDDVLLKAVATLLAGEHILLEDAPGVGKTLIGKALARSVSGSIARIQFTPDLLPADITGGMVYNQQKSEFYFRSGPIFANFVLADEINRATPRTQSSMLEAMSERQVSSEGISHPLPAPFMVIATQNPIEFEGTYPLPESQLDRFLMRVSVGYPQPAQELAILESHNAGEPVDSLAPVCSLEDIAALQEQVKQVRIEENVANYLLAIVEATRRSEQVRHPVSTRGTIAFYRAVKAWAVCHDRDFVTPDDLQQLAVSVLAHRIVAKGRHGGTRREITERIIEQLLQEVPVPV